MMAGDTGAVQILTDLAGIDAATAAEYRGFGEFALASVHEDRSAFYRLSADALNGSERAHLALTRIIGR